MAIYRTAATVQDFLQRYEVGETVGVGGTPVASGSVERHHERSTTLQGMRSSNGAGTRSQRTWSRLNWWTSRATQQATTALSARYKCCARLGVAHSIALTVAVVRALPPRPNNTHPAAAQSTQCANRRNLLQVDHPHCIKLFAVYITPRKVYIVTELVSGGELLDRCVPAQHACRSAACV